MKSMIVTATFALLAGGAFAQQNQGSELDSLKSVIKKQQAELEKKNAADTSNDEVFEFGSLRIINKDGKNKPGSDSTSIKHAGKSKKDKPYVNNSLRLDLGFNNYLHNGSFSLPAPVSRLGLNTGKSINANVHLFDQAVRLNKNRKWWAYYGVTLNYNNYRFNDNITLTRFNDSLRVLPDPLDSSTFAYNFDMKKNKLTTTYLTLPIGFQFESNPDKQKRSFRLAAGGYVGYLIGSHTKQVSSSKGKDKDYKDLNISNMRYGLNTKIGYGRFSMYVDYSLTPLFQKGKGPELYPVSFGIVINDFDF